MTAHVTLEDAGGDELGGCSGCAVAPGYRHDLQCPTQPEQEPTTMHTTSNPMPITRAVLAVAIFAAVALGAVLYQDSASGNGYDQCVDRRNGKPTWEVANPPDCEPAPPIEPCGNGPQSTPCEPEPCANECEPSCDDDNEPADNPQGCEQPVDPCTTNDPPLECFPPCAYPLGDTNECDPCDDLATAETEVCETPTSRPDAIDPTPTVPERTDTNVGTAAVLEAPAAVAVQGDADGPELAG